MLGSIVRASLLLVALAAPCLAGDWYVDVVNGSDANPGTSPASAWRTLTHASSATPSGSSNMIHVAPGTYSPASGETFPLRFGFQNVVGDQGSLVTIVEGGSGGGLALFDMY